MYRTIDAMQMSARCTNGSRLKRIVNALNIIVNTEHTHNSQIEGQNYDYFVEAHLNSSLNRFLFCLLRAHTIKYIKRQIK